MDVLQALFSALWVALFFFWPCHLVGTRPIFVRVYVLQTGHTTGQHVQMLPHLDFAADFCLPFPLTSSHPLRLPDNMWKMTIQAAMVKSGQAA